MLISASDIISRSLKLYGDNWKHLVKYVVLLLIPGLLVIVLTSASLLVLPGDSSLAIIVYFVLAIVVSLLSLWITIGLMKTIVDCYTGAALKHFKEELKLSAPLIVPVIIASLLAGLAILGGLIMLVIPGIIFALWFTFTTYAVIVDNKKTVEALKFSKSLVKGRWWGVFWRLLAPGVVFTVAIFIFQWLVGLPIRIMGGGGLALTLLSGLVQTVVQVFTAPLSIIAASIVYIELKRNQMPARVK